jgi:circadian clock protein KaiB
MKTPSKHTDSITSFEKALGRHEQEHYVLRLYITGTTPRSLRAVANIRAICEENLPGRYELEVIDIYQQPEHAKPEQIVVAPTLIKKLPLPVRKIIGDLSNKERVLAGLDVLPRRTSE